MVEILILRAENSFERLSDGCACRRKLLLWCGHCSLTRPPVAELDADVDAELAQEEFKDVLAWWKELLGAAVGQVTL
jgi:hypothetical protein